MATFHFELGNQPNRSGKTSIYLKVYEDGKRKRIKTTVEAFVKDWNKETEKVKKTASYSKEANLELERIRAKAVAIQRDLMHENALTLYNFISRMNESRHTDYLLEYMGGVRESLYTERKWGTWKKYGDSMNKLTAFVATLGLSDVELKDVSPVFVTKYRQFLMTQTNAKDPTGTKTLHPNSIAKHLKILRAVLNRAAMEGKIRAEQIPANLNGLKETATKTTGLTNESLEKILSLDLKGQTLLWHARNTYFFALYCAGARIGDVIQFRWSNVEGGRLYYKMRKNGKPIDIKLPSPAIELLSLYRKEDAQPNDYIFPYLCSSAEYAKYVSLEDRAMMPADLSKSLFDEVNSKEALIGKYLRKIAAMAGIKKFNFHSSRHTFAMKAKEKGTDSYLLKNMMNHASLKTTEVYMQRFDTEREDTALEGIFCADNATDKKAATLSRLKSLGISMDDLIELLDIGNALPSPRAAHDVAE